MCDGKAIEARLTSLVRRIFAQYQRQLEPEYVRQLDEAIHICKTYRQGVRDFTEELRTMWVLKTCILACSCWLGCRKERILTSASRRMWQADGFGMVI